MAADNENTHKIDMPVGELTQQSIHTLAKNLAELSKQYKALFDDASKFDKETQEASASFNKNVGKSLQLLGVFNKLMQETAKQKFLQETLKQPKGGIEKGDIEVQAKIQKQQLDLLLQVISGVKKQTQAEELLTQTKLEGLKKIKDLTELQRLKELELNKVALNKALGRQEELTHSQKVLDLLNAQMLKQEKQLALEEKRSGVQQRRQVAEAKLAAAGVTNQQVLTLAAKPRLPIKLDTLDLPALKQLQESRLVRQGQLLQTGDNWGATAAARQYEKVTQAIEAALLKQKELNQAQREMAQARKEADKINRSPELVRQAQVSSARLATNFGSDAARDAAIRDIKAVSDRRVQRQLLEDVIKQASFQQLSLQAIKASSSESELYLQKQAAILKMKEALAKGDLQAADAQKLILKTIQETNAALELQRKEQKLTQAQRNARELSTYSRDLKVGTEERLAQQKARLLEQEARRKDREALRQLTEEQKTSFRTDPRFTQTTVAAAKQLNHMGEIDLQILASQLRLKEARNRLDDEAIAKEKALTAALKAQQVALENLNKPKPPTPAAGPVLTPEQLAAQQRARTRARLFGDGGASLMLTQAGLIGNYQILNSLQSAITGAIGASVKLDQSFRNLQAISATTNTDMVSLKNNLIEVAKESKFSAVEISEAAVLLAQAGLSAKDIEKSMKAITLLAQASGTDIKNAVDVTTSVMSIFDKTAEQTSTVANQLTAALNTSKLDIQKLALGLQYAGNTAADSGLSFEELTASLGALANAGIRSGSTLGTGMSQVIIDLQKPTEQMKAKLAQLGLTMSDVDVRSHGFAQTMHTLKAAGFTVADAFQVMQVRSARAYAALVANQDVFQEVTEALTDSTAAVEANAVQMGSLGNQYARFKNNTAILASEALYPLNRVLKATFEALANLTSGLSGSSVALQGFFTIMGGTALAVMGSLISRLVVGMLTLTGQTSRASMAMGQLAAAGSAARLSMVGLTTGMAGAVAMSTRLTLALGSVGLAGAGLLSGLLALTGGWVGLAATVAIGTAAYFAYNNEQAKTNEALDKQKSKFDAAQEAYHSSKSAVESLNTALGKLQTRQQSLLPGSQELRNIAAEMQQQFRSLGLDLEDLSTLTLPELIKKITDLRDVMANKFVLDIQTKGQEKLELMKVQAKADRENLLKTLGTYSGAFVKDKGSMAETLNSATFKSLPADLQDLLTQGYTSLKSRAVGVVPDASRQFYANQLRDKALNANTFESKITVPVNAKLAELPSLSEEAKALVNQMVTEQTLVNEQLRRLAQAPAKQAEVAKNMARDQAEAAALNQYRQNPQNASLTVFKPASDKLQEAQILQSKLLKEGADPVETYTQIIEVLGGSMKQVKETLADNQKKINELGDDPKHLRKVLDSISEEGGEISSSMANFMADITKNWKQALARSYNKELESIKTQMDQLQQETRDAQPESQIRDREKKLQALIQRQKDVQLKLLEAEGKDAYSKKTGAEDIRDAALAQQKMAKALANKEVDKARKAYLEEVFRQDEEYFQAVADTQRLALEQEMENIKLQKDRKLQVGPAETLQQAENKLERMKNGVEGGFTSNWAVTQQEKEVSKLRGKAQKYQIEVLHDFLTQTDELLASLRDSLLQMTTNRDALRIEMQTLALKQKAEGLTPEEVDRLNRGNKVLRMMDTSVTDLQTRVKTLEDQRVTGVQETQAAVAAADTNPPAGKAPRGQQLRTMYDNFVNQYQEIDPIVSTLTAGLDAAKQGFSDFFATIVSGTGSARDAFEAMGKSILTSMLKVISDRVAVQFLDLLMGSAASSPTAQGGYNFLKGGLQPLLATGASWLSGLGSAGGGAAHLAGFEGGSLASMLQGYSYGGPIQGYATGGKLPDIGRDSTIIAARGGEYMIQPSATKALGEDFLNNLNQMTVADVDRMKTPKMPVIKAGNPVTTNVWVVPPDQVPPPSESDVVAYTANNIKKGGALKQLIKQVVKEG